MWSIVIEDIHTAHRYLKSLGILEARHRSLKVEEVCPKEYETSEEAQASIGAWVKRYNYTHSHSALAYVPPIEYRVDRLAVLAYNRGKWRDITRGTTNVSSMFEIQLK